MLLNSFNDEVNKFMQLASHLNKEYGLDVATISLLPHGADLYAKVYKATTTDQREYFVKVKSSNTSFLAIDVVKLLANSGIQEVLLPIKTLRGDEWLTVGTSIVVVYPFIKGHNGFVQPLSNEQWVQLGKALRFLHKISVPLSFQNKIGLEEYSDKWQVAVRKILHAPNQNEITAILEEKKSIISELVQRTDTLKSKLKGMSLEPVLCHADIHAGNVFLAENRALYIVDWDAPIMAPKERDLMFIGGGVANCWNKPDEEAAFYQGYGKTQINTTALTYFRARRILEDIVEYYEAFATDAKSESERKTMYEQFCGMFDSNGVVDIALRS